MSLLGLFISVCVLISCDGIASRMTLKTKYGDIYDCIDFYKQPSFGHPMLKNHNFHPLMRPSFLPKHAEREPHIQGCPVGTVPIRRMNKNLSKIESLHTVNEPSGTYNAGVRTILGSTKYRGGGMILSVWNPRVRPLTYSQARMKISSGSDAIQVGWRVDTSLRGDNLTRQFIYTDAGDSHCFDAHCGFVIVSSKYPLDQVLEPLSQPGGPIYVAKFNITQDPQSGNWWLVYGYLIQPEETAIGFWPKNIFKGLEDYASNVEWAGEVYSPIGINEPVMGSGYKPNVEDTSYVALFAFLTIVNENYTSVNVDKLEEFATDRSLYNVRDEGVIGPLYDRLILYGGARY